VGVRGQQLGLKKASPPWLRLRTDILKVSFARPFFPIVEPTIEARSSTTRIIGVARRQKGC
jgi:hypothetical protein